MHFTRLACQVLLLFICIAMHVQVLLLLTCTALPVQVSLRTVAEAVGSVQDVYFVLVQEPLYNTFIDIANQLFGAPTCAVGEQL